MRKFIINQLICHFELSFNSINEKFSVDMQSDFTRELQELTPMINDDLIIIDAQGIRVHNAGRMLIRRICMVFDEYLNNTTQIRYSKII